VICPSRFIESLVGRTGRPTRWLPHPAPPVAAVERRVEKPGPLRLVFAGRLQPEKGLDPLLRAMPAVWDGTLTVIGDGPERPRCEETCRQLGLAGRVRFLGRRSHAETLAELTRAHVLVLPSLFMESYGLVLIEALAAGTNVLASDRGACRELIEDAGAGYLFPPGDANNLAMQLDRIHRAHAAGTLNRFDVSHLLAARSDAAYVEALWEIYRGDAMERVQAA
jgi:glycosyltransferase involved in cell wall biosynthesis